MTASTDSHTSTPAQAWKEMVRGNQRFVDGTPRHPRQDVERRAELAATQEPHAVLFGCSDSRLAAEIIFDKGLGDLFVVRNAGQVISDSVIGSLEFAVAVLHVPLIVVLGHDKCGAVTAAINSQLPDAPVLPPQIGNLVASIVPAVARVKANTPEGSTMEFGEVLRQHVQDTIENLLESSELISDAIAAGTLAIVGARYRLVEGAAVPDFVVGAV